MWQPAGSSYVFQAKGKFESHSYCMRRRARGPREVGPTARCVNASPCVLFLVHKEHGLVKDLRTLRGHMEQEKMMRREDKSMIAFQARESGRLMRHLSQHLGTLLQTNNSNNAKESHPTHHTRHTVGRQCINGAERWTGDAGESNHE